jgi:FkbM family methyltransferase
MIYSWLPITKLKIFGAQILYRFTTLFTGNKKRIIERKGVKYEIDLSEGMELSLFLFGNFQSHITANPFLKVKPDDVILDVGANVGLMSLQFAHMVPAGKVYSFEPTHYALERLKKNLSLNPALAQNITVVNSFVSEKSDTNPEIVAYSSWKVDGQRGLSDHPVHWGTPKGTEGVPAISLNDFVEKFDVQRIDLIKIDTDGHEYEVFKGANLAIQKFRPKIIFEIGLYVMDEKKIDFEFYFNYFSQMNYSLVDTKTSAEISLKNYRKYIPKKGSTDLIALPR